MISFVVYDSIERYGNMKSKTSRYAFLLTMMLLVGFTLASCSGAAPAPATSGESESVSSENEDDEHMDDDEHMEDEAGHTDDEDEHMEDEHVHMDVPTEYEGLTNPYAADEAARAAGATLFASLCASCHGEGGMGDGPAATGLNPKPASLADAEMMMDMSDAYIFWRITEGGLMEPFNSAMPPWGESLSEDQIWQLVTYVRALAE
jgi:cytochrome c553